MVRVFSPWHDDFSRLARALRNSLVVHAPCDWIIDVPDMEPEPVTAADEKIAGNVRQFKRWGAAVKHHNDGDRLLLLDTDMYARRDIGGIFDAAGDPDLFYTTRPGAAEWKPLSTGVLGVLVSDRTRAFFQRMEARIYELLAGQHAAARIKYGGIQQPALGTLLEEGAAKGMTVTALPCSEWNASAPENYGQGQDARLVHVHGSVPRRAVLGQSDYAETRYADLVKEWRRLEAL